MQHAKYKQVLTVGYAWAGLFNSCYAVHNGVIAYVVNNKLFVTPKTKSAMKTLQEVSFEKKAFLVPLSDGDYPEDTSVCKRWDALKARV